MKKTIVTLILLSSYLLSSNLEFVYKTPESSIDKEFASLVQNSKRVKEAEHFLNDFFILKDKVKIVFGAQDGHILTPQKIF